MPNIYVDGPPIDVEAKRTFVKEVTDAAVNAFDIPAEGIIVVIRENPAENVSIGGCLLCDARAEMQE